MKWLNMITSTFRFVPRVVTSHKLDMREGNEIKKIINTYMKYKI